MVETDIELLKYAIENGIINVTAIQAKVELMRRAELLASHKYAIWQDKQGLWYTTFQDEKSRKRKQIRRRSRELLDDAIVEHYENKAPTFEDVFYLWVDAKTRYGEIQQQTVDRYRLDYLRFLQGTALSRRKMADITENELEEFIKTTIHERNLSPKGWGNLRVLIGGTMRYAAKHGMSNIHPKIFFDEIEISRKSFRKVRPKDNEQVFTREEQSLIEAKLTEDTTDVVNLGILLTFETGLRVGELSALKASDIHPDYLEVQRTEVRYKENGEGSADTHVREWTKGHDGYRRVILTSRAKRILEMLVSYNGDAEYLFEKHGKRLKGTAFTSKLLRVCKTLSITPRTMHKIRKTYATTLLNAGIDEKLIMKQMGHQDILTTKHYYYFDNTTLDEAKKELDKIRE